MDKNQGTMNIYKTMNNIRQQSKYVYTNISA